MKKIGIVIIAVAIILIGGGALWYFNSGNNNNADTNTNAANLNAASGNVNQQPANATYAKYSGALAQGFQFDVVDEWTSVAPEEVQKSITEEQRNGYSIIYYATNPEAVVFAVSVKSTDGEAASLEDIVDSDIANAQQTQSTYAVTSKQVNAADAKVVATVSTASAAYTVSTRYLGLPEEAYGKPSWTLLEVSVPTTRVGAYAGIVDHLLSALELSIAAAANTNDSGFAANGEKINDRVYREQFETIEFGVLKKNADASTMTYGRSSLDYEEEQNGYHVVTSGEFSGTQTLTIKAYDYAASRLFDGSSTMSVKPGSNSQCCFSPPGVGRYQYLFYLGNDLVKTLELISE